MINSLRLVTDQDLTPWMFKKQDYQRALSDAKEAAKLKPTDKKYDDLLYAIKSAMTQ